MQNKPPVYIGFDPSNHPQPFCWAVVDARPRLVELSEGSLEDALARAADLEAARVAVNSPTGLALGLVNHSGPRRGRKPTKASSRAQNLRVAEDQLQQCGIKVARTPSVLEDCPRWMQGGFSLHRGLEKLGYNSPPGETRRKAEANVEAMLHAVLKQTLFTARSLEGRIQRQIILFDLVGGMHDPMEFFEEVTRRRLMTGSLPTGCLYSIPQLHAIGAAYTAWLDAQKPGQLVRLGHPDEGLVTLPEWEGFDRFRQAQAAAQPEMF